MYHVTTAGTKHVPLYVVLPLIQPSYYNQPARGDPSGRRSPHSQSAAQGDDSSHTDSSGGIFAKLRGEVARVVA